MCGIAGIVYRDRERPVAESLVRGMCSELQHRGPDDEGLYVCGAVGLGMRRLSIIDLSGGHQPIFNEDGSKAIVFNGEIYNYRELRHGLIARGHTLRTAGDTETVLHLYEEQGPACVDRLRGMFAYAIWDAAAETLVLTRDRFGIKPLYIVTGDWGIAFASELKALHAAGLTSRELDWEALDAYIQLGYVPAPATPFRDVRKLEPGHWLRWRRTGELTVRPYWDLPQGTIPAPPDIEQRVVKWIDASVAAHLVSDVPVAAFLSGGLDSSAVVASVTAVASRPEEVPHAFTARYHGSGAAAADETELARLLAGRYGVPLTVVDISPEVRDVFEPIVYALDEPHADDSAIPTWALSKIVGSRYKVALTGIGGDELFGGYRRYAGMLAAEHYDRLPRPLRAAAAALGPAVDGAHARDPRPAGGARPRRAGVPLARALQGSELAAETTVEACARLTDPRRALQGAEARLRGPHGGVAAARAPQHGTGRVVARPHGAAGVLRSDGSARAVGRPLLAASQPRSDPLGVAVLLDLAPALCRSECGAPPGHAPAGAGGHLTSRWRRP